MPTSSHASARCRNERPSLSAQTLNDALERAARTPRAGLRLLDRRQQATWLSWRRIHAAALEACGRLQASGVAAGDRVALVSPPNRDFLAAFFGAMLAGAVPVPLPPPAPLGGDRAYRERLVSMLARLDPAVVLVGPGARRLGKVWPRAANGEPVELEALPPGDAIVYAAQPEHLALIQFSSGTGGEPRPAALSHRALLAQIKRLNAYWPDSAERKHEGVSWLPLHHDMGLVGCLLTCLERPGVLTLMPPELFAARPASWLQTISRYRATVSPAPNFAYARCVEMIRDEEMEGVDLSSWRVALNGAEAVAPMVLRTFSERFARWGFTASALTPVYGLAEAALAVTFSDPEASFATRRFCRRALAENATALDDDQGIELVSVGRPLEGFELRLVDLAGDQLAERKVGRLLVRGPSLMDGYFGDEEATQAALLGGWLDTGDTAFICDGELFLTGRTKELLVLRGRNLSPQIVESAVRGVAGVHLGAAIALSLLPEGGQREELLLIVEGARELAAGDLDELVAACRRRVLAEAALGLDRLVVVAADSLPRTTSGKIRRQEALRAHLMGGLKVRWQGRPSEIADRTAGLR